MPKKLHVLYITIIAVIAAFSKGQDTSQCPKGWLHHDESCYLLHSGDKFNWPESQIFCSGHRAHLAFIDDNSENVFVKGMIAQAFGGQKDANVWLGASDDAFEGLFTWYGTDEPLTFTDWGPNEPNSIPLHLDEDCLAYWASYNWKWADFDCHSQCYFVCERPAEESSVIVG